MAHLESKIQQSCVKWFRLAYRNIGDLLFAVPNGGGRSKIEACIMKGEGVLPGVSDLILLVPNDKYSSLCIEMKKQTITWDDKGKEHVTRTYQRPCQKEWQSLAEKYGNKYIVVRSLDEFVAEVKDYLSTANI